MYCTVLAIVILLPSRAVGLVDCLVACTRCQEHSEEYPGVLEVYCAMCQECNDRRREQRSRQRAGSDGEQIIYNLENYPEDCPTPPACEWDTDNDISPHTLAHTVRPTTSSSSATTSTTTRRPCPVVTGCKKKISSPKPRCYYPCVPACPCPYPQLYSSAVPNKLSGSTTTRRSTGFLYVYVGVPRDVLHKTN